MKKGYVGLLACASGILIGLGISRLDLTGYLEKTQEQEYHPVERKVPESVESKLKDPKQCWLCGSDERSMMDYFRKFDDLGVICTNHWYVMDMHIRNLLCHRCLIPLICCCRHYRKSVDRYHGYTEQTC